MMTQYTYFIILACCIAGPFALSFDKKVAFYKDWKYAVPAIIIPAIFFIGWDTAFTKLGVWSFNSEYVIGANIINIPLEEALFFFVVPYCCLFIYACIRSYFPEIKNNQFSTKFLICLSAILMIAAIVFHDKNYSFYTFLLFGIFILIVLMARQFFKSFNRTAFLISYCVILLPFLAVNGILTSWPVVLYNNSENLNIRIFTIPLEDIFYGMFLAMMNIVIYDKLKPRSSSYSK